MFDKRGEVDPAKIQRAFDVVETMKAEGIYTHFSIYFPLWFDPPADLDWLPGYDGKTHPFATLYFNPKFQEKYRSWWKALLTTPSPTTGKRLIDEPAVFGAELINEDSFFFWTFNDKNIPDPQLRILEQQFGEWLKSKYGSLDKAFAAWNGQKIDRDTPAEGRIGFRPLWNIAHERTPRDQDTARFLTEAQRRFYDETYAVPARARLPRADHRLELGDGQPGGLRAAGKVHLHGGRLHRPARLLRLPQRGAELRVVDPRRPHLRRPQRVAIRERRTRQARVVRASGDGPAATTTSRR